MSTTTWYISFLWFLYIQGSIYAFPTTPPPGPFASESLSAGHAHHRRDITLTLNKKPYNVERLSQHEQGSYSTTYRFIDGFQVGNKRVPAILKLVSEGKAESEDSKTSQEIGFLKRDSVDLYLYHEWSKAKDTTNSYYLVSIVVRDVGALDPPFKPFYQWYDEDKTMNVVESLRNVRKNIEERLRWYREEQNLLYKDIKPENIYIRKAATQPLGMKRDINSSVQVMPIDWGPQTKYAGVVDVASLAKDTKSLTLLRHVASVRRLLQEKFSVEALYDDLKWHGLALRKQDIVQKKVNDKTYDLLPLIEEHTSDSVHTYAIIGGFENEKALMRVTSSPDKSVVNAMIERMRKEGTLLDSQFKSDEACIIYIDPKRDQE